MKTSPTFRNLGCAFELFIQVEAGNPLKAEKQAMEAIEKINAFMRVQQVEKKDFSLVTPVSLGSSVTWEWPLDWRPGALRNERYIHKISLLLFRYFEDVNS